MLTAMKEMLLQAQKKGCAVPSPDFWDSVSARAFVSVAEKYQCPLILSYAPIHREILSLEEAAEIGKFYAEQVSVPVALHLDHGTDMTVIRRAIALGFTSVMIDASAESFEDNVRKTKEVTEYAHTLGIDVEAEIGHVGSEDAQGPHTVSATSYTEPGMAAEFVRLTNVDALAVSIGTSHGVYKNGTPHINFDILKSIRDVTDVPLVLHGGSGTGDDNLRRCAELGICKVNIYTDYIQAALKQTYAEKQDSWPKVIEQAEKAVKDVHEHYCRVLKCI